MFLHNRTYTVPYANLEIMKKCTFSNRSPIHWRPQIPKKIIHLWIRSYNGFFKFINSFKNLSNCNFTNATHTSNIISQFPKESSFFSTHVFSQLELFRADSRWVGYPVWPENLFQSQHCLEHSPSSLTMWPTLSSFFNAQHCIWLCRSWSRTYLNRKASCSDHAV